VETLLPLAIILGASPSVDDGPADDPDWVAPYLGLDLLSVEDLRSESSVDGDDAHATHLPISAPFWARLLPDLTIAVQHRAAKQRLVGSPSGWSRDRDGWILVMWAVFPLPEGPGPRESVAAVAANAPGRRMVDADAACGESSAPAADQPGVPTVQEVQLAAERASVTPLSVASGWASRARTAALLPELTLDYRRNVGEIDTLGVRSDLGIDSHNIEDITRYGVRATWQLSQIVFNRDELNAAQTAEAIEHARRDLLVEVSRLYFQWQALLAELAAGASLERARREQLRRDAALTVAQIDALTGGFLSRAMGTPSP
jgi:hypothetical protein